jgi:hypothetical protein
MAIQTSRWLAEIRRHRRFADESLVETLKADANSLDKTAVIAEGRSGRFPQQSNLLPVVYNYCLAEQNPASIARDVNVSPHRSWAQTTRQECS